MIDYKLICTEEAINEAGLGYIFSLRSRKLNFWLNLTKALTVLSVSAPGAIVLNYSVNHWWVQIIVSLAIILSTYLTISSLIQMALSSDAKLNYYYESAAHHNQLMKQFSLLKSQDEWSSIYIYRFHELIGEQSIRDSQDERYNLTDRELRIGMRYGLRMFQKECSECKTVPVSLESTNCNVCGNF